MARKSLREKEWEKVLFDAAEKVAGRLYLKNRYRIEYDDIYQECCYIGLRYKEKAVKLLEEKSYLDAYKYLYASMNLKVQEGITKQILSKLGEFRFGELPESSAVKIEKSNLTFQEVELILARGSGKDYSKLLESANPRRRAILDAVYTLKMSHEEASEVLGESIKQVESQILAAKKVMMLKPYILSER